jgi:glycosyltransferase involved in cell wall biosynthesis
MVKKESKMVEFTLVLPSYNEEKYLEKCVTAVKSKLKDKDYEIIIVEDGCTDKTPQIAEKLAKGDKKIKHIHSDIKLGRGKAVRNAFEIATGKYIGFVDVDLAVDIKYLDELLKYIKKYDVVTGSKFLEESEVNRPRLRQFTSSMYHAIIRLLFSAKNITDAQCGFKMFSREFVEKVGKHTLEDSWAWDTEIVVLANVTDFSTKEIPVAWKEKRRTRTPIRRLFKDIKIHGTLLINLFYRIKMKKYPFLNVPPPSISLEKHNK